MCICRLLQYYTPAGHSAGLYRHAKYRQKNWFDNVKIGQYTSSVVEEDHYYPFGLCLNTKEAPTNIAANNKKYQGIELEKHFGLETYETQYRGLDPQLGRFNSIDPKADSTFHISLYASMNNDPARYTDPKGDVAFLLPLIPVIYEAVAAATVATIAYYASKDAGEAMARNSQKPSSSQDQAKKRDEANPHETSRAARRDAMREQGIPTSQPLINDKATRSKDKVYTTRDGEYTVQDAKNDVSHQGQSHWEAGKTKKDQSQPDGLNRSGNNNKPQMQQPKGKSYYGPSLFIAPIVPLVKYLLSE